MIEIPQCDHRGAGGRGCTNPAAWPSHGRRPSRGCVFTCPHFKGDVAARDRAHRELLGAAPGTAIDPPGAPTRRVKRRPLTRRDVARFLRAELSLRRQGPVSDEVRAERLAHCAECEHRVRAAGGGDFCNECGCGEWSRAELSVKTWMPKASCPLKEPKWGHAPGTGRGDLDKVGGEQMGLVKLSIDAALSRLKGSGDDDAER